VYVILLIKTELSFNINVLGFQLWQGLQTCCILYCAQVTVKGAAIVTAAALVANFFESYLGAAMQVSCVASMWRLSFHADSKGSQTQDCPLCKCHICWRGSAGRLGWLVVVYSVSRRYLRAQALNYKVKGRPN